MTTAPRTLPAALALALLVAGCTAQPRYPLDPNHPAGGGFSVAPPRYATSGDAPATSPKSAPATPAEAPMPASPVHRIDASPLPAPMLASNERTDRLAAPPSRARGGRSGPATGEVQVQPFETIYDVAERVHTPIRALVELNGLRPPYAIEAGEILKVPSSAAYTIVAGDTLFGVARRFHIDPRSLASLNGVPFEQKLRLGQTLVLPAKVIDGGAQAGANGAAPVPAANAAVPRPTVAVAPPPPRPPVEAPPRRPESAPANESEVAALAKGRFIWPVHGPVLSSFGPKGPGQRNDGVNIEAEAGESVHAAAAGVVVYAGNSIPAFGNLVLIKHPGGWATLYGNLGKITVATNAAVSQGQEVGSAGVSGAVDRPQVHFEIRYAPDPHDKAKPYDPSQLLSGPP